MTKLKAIFPPVGARIIKSAVAVLLCFLIYHFIRKNGIVFYSQLACLWCMQPLWESTVDRAVQRTKGTIVGALMGLIVLLIDKTVPLNELVYVALVSFFIVITLYVTGNYKMKNASYFSCVVFLSIVINHIGDANPFVFTFNRFVDTMIGIGVGMGVNSFRLPCKKQTDTLFISGIDDTLPLENNKLNAYSVVELNRMIEDGAKFTISTKRTPASLREPLRGVNLKLPVIAMDGAILYSLSENHYIKVFAISKELTNRIKEFLNGFGINYFVNQLIDDTLLIQYKELLNDAEKNIYSKLKNSPYRNYTTVDLGDKADCVYFMLIDKSEVTEQIYEELSKKEFFSKLRVEHYKSDDYPGYSYIKIYSHSANRKRMTEYLKEYVGVSKTVTFGSIEGQYDVIVHKFDTNKVAKTLKCLYEPGIFS